MELDLTNTFTLIGILVAAAIAFWRIKISNTKRIDRLLTEHRNEIRHEVNEKMEVLRGDVHGLRGKVHGLDRRLSTFGRHPAGVICLCPPLERYGSDLSSNIWTLLDCHLLSQRDETDPPSLTTPLVYTFNRCCAEIS